MAPPAGLPVAKQASNEWPLLFRAWPNRTKAARWYQLQSASDPHQPISDGGSGRRFGAEAFEVY